jgi:hypothetical protein
MTTILMVIGSVLVALAITAAVLTLIVLSDTEDDPDPQYSRLDQSDGLAS